MTTKPRVAIVFGGQSSEHAISCATAAGVLGAIDRNKYDVVPIGITHTGQWLLAADDATKLQITDTSVPEVTLDDGAEIALGMGMTDRQIISVDAVDALVAGDGDSASHFGRVDVVFPLLHGPFGEDGTVQGLFEIAGLPYVGSGVLASAVGMDKHYMKIALEAAGLPVGPYEVITPAQWQRNRQEALTRAESLEFPVFVKPCRAGSSIGITKVKSPGELTDAIEVAQAHDPKVIIETGVEGREIEVSVLEGRDGNAPRTTLPGEVIVSAAHEFYTYEAKYFDPDAADLVWPAEVPDELAADARQLAADVFDALSCEGLARVDLFYSDDGELLVNEANTMPGFTPFSMYPLMWQRSGVSYTELITELIELALNRPKGLR